MDNLCLDFLNSQWQNNQSSYKEPLQDENWVKNFLKKWELKYDTPLSSTEFQQLITLRTLLFEVINDLCNDSEIPEKSLQEINYYLALTPLTYKLTKKDSQYESILEPIVINWDCILHKITLSLIEFILKNDIHRIRICQNPECKWAFYDESKNSIRKWCGNTCASLIKVRRFREKQKNQTTE